MDNSDIRLLAACGVGVAFGALAVRFLGRRKTHIHTSLAKPVFPVDGRGRCFSVQHESHSWEWEAAEVAPQAETEASRSRRSLSDLEGQPDMYRAAWEQREAAAEAMLFLIGQLYRQRDVVSCLFGRRLVGRSVTELLTMHENSPVSIFDTYAAVQRLQRRPLPPCRLDLGQTISRFTQQRPQGGGTAELDSWLEGELQRWGGLRSGAVGETAKQDVVLYGLGRIGRLLARILLSKTGAGKAMRLRAIVVRKSKGCSTEEDLLKRVNLVKHDSVHGTFQGTLKPVFEEGGFLANGQFVHLIYSDDPSNVDYTSKGIHNAILIDNTGAWRDNDSLSRHLKSQGVGKVLLTAPGKGMPTIVAGVNHEQVQNEDRLLSCASCTTNAIVPVLKVLMDTFGVTGGHIETVHSFTNDQNLIDNFHPKSRRGRAATLNMVITETGAGSAVAKVMPELKGLLTANAIRVPTPNVSMAILSLTLRRAVDKESLNAALKEASLTGPMQQQIGYTESEEAVSSDFVGSEEAGVIDSLSTIVSGDRCNVYIWYDNECGYSHQVSRVLQTAARIEPPQFPAP